MNKKQDILNSRKSFDIDVGRGSVKVEANKHDSNGSAGITFKSSDKATNTSPILAVRDSSDISRLWVGYSFSGGGNKFLCGYSGSVGNEGVEANYAHRFDTSGARLAGNVDQVAGQFRCGFKGGDEANAGNYVYRFSAVGATIGSPDTPIKIDNLIGNTIEYKQGGIVLLDKVGSTADTREQRTLGGSGVTIHTSTHGPFRFPKPYPTGVKPIVTVSGYENNISGHYTIIRIWVSSVSNTEFSLAVSEFANSNNVRVAWHASSA